MVEDHEEAARISRVRDAKSLYIYRGATLSPWKLVAHILRDALQRGLNLQTNTTVTGISPGADGSWNVLTPRGVVNCRQVVHATNAYAAALLPEFEGLIRPTPHLVHRVVPPTSHSGSKALEGSYHIICKDHAIHSINTRSTSDGNICFGGANPGYGSLREWVALDPKNAVDDSLARWPSIKDEVVSMSCKQLWPEVKIREDRAGLCRLLVWHLSQVCGWDAVCWSHSRQARPVRLHRVSLLSECAFAPNLEGIH